MTKVFISYSHTDEPYRIELEKHLSVLKRNKFIDTWSDRMILAGQNWGTKISSELEEAKVILLLISSDFLASNYCYDIEMHRAIERHNTNEAVVVPIIIRFCDWSNTPFSMLQGLPLNAKPVKDWADIDQAFLNIVDGIKALIYSINNTMPLSFNNLVLQTPKEKLAEIYQKVLTASGERELKIQLFNLIEYKKFNPPSFAVEELEELINNSLKYEEGHSIPSCSMPPMGNKMSKRTGGFQWLLPIVVTLIILLILYYLIRHNTE